MQRIQHNPNQNQQRGTSIKLSKLVIYPCYRRKSRQYRYKSQENRTRQCNSRHNRIQKLMRVVVSEAEAVALIRFFVIRHDGVAQAAGLAHYWERAVPHGDHLGYAARLKDLQKELKLTETQVQGLEGAISKQNEAVASAKLNNLSSGVKNVRESMSGVLTLMRSMDSLIRLVGQSSSEELDASSERLSELEESLDSVKQAYEDGIITQEQYIESTSRLNAEVANEKAVLAELEEQQKKQADTRPGKLFASYILTNVIVTKHFQHIHQQRIAASHDRNAEGGDRERPFIR